MCRDQRITIVEIKVLNPFMLIKEIWESKNLHNIHSDDNNGNHITKKAPKKTQPKNKIKTKK